MELDSVLALLGLSLPKIYAVNRVTELVQEWLKDQEFWDDISEFSEALPFLVAMVLSSFGESGCENVIGSGLIYGGAAIAMHHLKPQPESQPP